MSSVTLEKVISLCKRRGFVYPSADIYGGLNGIYDFGHLGVLLRNNIKDSWIKSIFKANKNMLLFDGSIIGHHDVWKASGHVDNFSDPMVDCTSCKHRYRTDEIDIEKSCPHCGNKAWTQPRQFNMMFQTQLGAAQGHSSVAYLRPETAQSIYVNFKNAITTNRIKVPFGIAQIGKAFRNEITPKQFLFRMREFEQMEMEWFCKGEDAAKYFDFWVNARHNYYLAIGLNAKRLRLYQQGAHERAHYSVQTTDIEYEFPFGFKEIEGIANRGDYDLTQHTNASGKELAVHDEAAQLTYTPHIVETSVGVDRLFLTLLFDSYKEELVEDEMRIVLSLHPRMAPIKAAFLPLTKKLNEPMLKIYESIADLGYMVDFDDSGSIGKRYRRQDEIGTPVCFTFDFDSLEDNSVTVRDRDTTQQQRISIDQIALYLAKVLAK